MGTGCLPLITTKTQLNSIPVVEKVKRVASIGTLFRNSLMSHGKDHMLIKRKRYNSHRANTNCAFENFTLKNSFEVSFVFIELWCSLT